MKTLSCWKHNSEVEGENNWKPRWFGVFSNAILLCIILIENVKKRIIFLQFLGFLTLKAKKNSNQKESFPKLQ